MRIYPSLIRPTFSSTRGMSALYNEKVIDIQDAVRVKAAIALLPEQKILVVGRGSTELEQVLQGTHLKSAELNPDDIQNIIKTDSGANHVSRVHLAITRREGQLVAWDLDSSFGTMDHNKQPFIHAGNSSAEKPVPLMPGQILWLGGVVALQLPKAI